MTAQLLILAMALAASGSQTPTNPQPSSNIPDDRLSTVPAPAPITVEGCVATTREVKGGSTNLADRIGLDDGFVLTAPRIVKGRAPRAATAPAGTPRMFAISGLRDEQLKPLLGQRVRIEGSILAGDAPDVAKDPPAAALTVTTIRQIAGTCPAPATSGR